VERRPKDVTDPTEPLQVVGHPCLDTARPKFRLRFQKEKEPVSVNEKEWVAAGLHIDAPAAKPLAPKEMDRRASERVAGFEAERFAEQRCGPENIPLEEIRYARRQRHRAS